VIIKFLFNERCDANQIVEKLSSMKKRIHFGLSSSGLAKSRESEKLA
jgi:hypothetical protein